MNGIVAVNTIFAAISLIVTLIVLLFVMNESRQRSTGYLVHILDPECKQLSTTQLPQVPRQGEIIYFYLLDDVNYLTDELRAGAVVRVVHREERPIVLIVENIVEARYLQEEVLELAKPK